LSSRLEFREVLNMTETTLVFRSQIAAPAADVLAWHGSPGAFERLTPPWMDVRVMEAAGGIAPGDWKRLRVAAGPIGPRGPSSIRPRLTAPASSTSSKMVPLHPGGTSIGS
jgi:hypothetical protein